MDLQFQRKWIWKWFSVNEIKWLLSNCINITILKMYFVPNLLKKNKLECASWVFFFYLKKKFFLLSTQWMSSSWILFSCQKIIINWVLSFFPISSQFQNLSFFLLSPPPGPNILYVKKLFSNHLQISPNQSNFFLPYEHN